MDDANINKEFNFSKSADENINCANKENKHIKCHVDNCKHHSKEDCYCCKECITVDSPKDKPIDCSAVDCKSFEADIM